LPSGLEDTRGYLTGTDSHGGYSGTFDIGGTPRVVTWTGGQPTVPALPKGFDSAYTVDENTSGLIVGDLLGSSDGRAFVLQGATFTQLPQPSGYNGENVRAVNERGDVLGILFAENPANDVAVVWPQLSSGNGPLLIPFTHEGQNPIDIDDDGTVLFASEDGALLWRGGTLSALRNPSGYTYSYPGAIRDGVVVGDASSAAAPNSQAFRWNTTPQGAQVPVALPDGTWAGAINSAGLTVGADDHNQPLTWQGATPAGSLPIPSGYTAAVGGAVGDDNVVLGHASNGPLDQGGVPMIWQQR
jgi:hypothetical protein